MQKIYNYAHHQFDEEILMAQSLVQRLGMAHPIIQAPWPVPQP